MIVDHFFPVIEKAKDACKNSGQLVEDHFEDFLGMVNIGSGAKRNVEDINLSRYACYLILSSRQTIKELGGTMPEDLPTPKKSIDQVKKKRER